jgi:hypothetical protein
MPIYLDAHKMQGIDEETLKQAKNSPKDEFGVTHNDILYNKDEDKLYCVLDAPNKEAVEKHHEKFGVKCDWITEVKSIE